MSKYLYIVTHLSFSLQVSAPAEQASAPTAPLYSDPGIQFELKGRNFPSAPPLSSDSTFCHVYTSDKLNYIWNPWIWEAQSKLLTRTLVWHFGKYASCELVPAKKMSVA